MNLINDAWIPVRRADGTTEKIEPWRLTDHIDTGKSPIVAVASPRSDFDGAITQFLIGLLQTTCTPATEAAWWEWRESPPSLETLRNQMESVKTAFEFEGDGPRFMQDLVLGPADFEKKKKNQKSTEGKEEEDEEGLIPISNLFIEAPGRITRKENRDHFVKRDFVENLCAHCAAAALFTLQTNSPGRGSGYRTGLRGGGPLTTLVLCEDNPLEPRSLWATCWLNVLDKAWHLSGKHGNSEKQRPEDRFPWLAPTRTSENKGVTTPDDIHPDQQYWAMPQRIRLIASSTTQPTRCGLCGNDAKTIYRHYYAKKYGVNYKGDFKHPLSPYDLIDGHLRSVLTEPGGIGYRHWVGVIENDPSAVRQRADVVERLFTEVQADAQVWAFGYDIYNSNKVRGWTDAVLPVLHMRKEVRELFVPIVKNMTVTANRVCGMILLGVLRANFMKPKSKKKKKSKDGKDYLDVIWECPKPFRKFNRLEDRMDETVLNDQRAMMFSARTDFWGKSEGSFLDAIKDVRDLLSGGSNEISALERWLTILKQEALTVFDTYSQTGDFDAVDPRRVALARYELAKSLKKLRDLLGLPRQDRSAA